MKMWRLEESEVQGDKTAFPQTVTIPFESRLRVLLGPLSFSNRIFPSHMKCPTAFKRTPARAVKAGFDTFDLAFIVPSGCFGDVAASYHGFFSHL